MDKLYIVIPAYNEAENIIQTAADWYDVLERHNPHGEGRLVIVNDGSRDNTLELLEKEKKKRPDLIVLDQANAGHGAAVLAGYQFAIREGADYIFQTDSDGQTNPAEFEAFWSLRDRYRAVIGERFKRGDGKQRAFVEKVLCRILKHYFGVRLKDANVPFRLMSRAYLERLLPKLPEKYNLPNAVLTALGVYYHEPVLFLPVSFRPRQGGVNSINVRKIIGIGRRALKDFRRIRENLD